MKNIFKSILACILTALFIGGVSWAATLLPIQQGGTGSSTAQGARTNLLPSQSTANGKVLQSNGTDVTWETPVAGTSVILDLADNGVNESTAITEIATSGDTNSIFTEPAGDKLLIDLSKDWPKADLADALNANGANCDPGNAPLGVDASGAVEGCFAVVTGTPWTGMGYLTSLSGAVLTSQSTGQTIGDTTNRLTKLWATDITVTNAITGSVTGNAGTVTNATLTTAFTNNGGAGTLAWPAAGATLTIPTGGGTLGTAAFTAATAYKATGTEPVTTGGTGLATIADGSILATNAADTLSAITWHSAGTKVLTNTSGTITWEDAAAGGGATTALDNLASVAINTSLVSDTDNTDALGTAAIGWSDLFLGNGSVITWSSAPSTSDMTLTHSANLLTLSGGSLAIDNIISVTGNIDIAASTSAVPTENGGEVYLTSGDGLTTGWGGNLYMFSGAGGNDGPGGSVTFGAGEAGGGDNNGGDIYFTSGAGSGSGTDGRIMMTNGNFAGTKSGILDFNLIADSNKTFTFPNLTGTILVDNTIDASSELLALMDDETGTGALTFATAPTFTTSITVPLILTGNVALTIGDATTDGITLTTDGTGNGELTLPADVIGDADIDWGTGAGQIDLADILAGGDVALTDGGTGASTAELGYNNVADMVAAPASDHTANGPHTNDIAAGANITVMDLVILSSDGKLDQTDANAAATYSGMLAVSLESKTDTQAMNVALPGSIIRDDTWNWTPGAVLYISETAGAITATQPTTTDAAIRVVGYSISADEIYFNPSPDYITHI